MGVAPPASSFIGQIIAEAARLTSKELKKSPPTLAPPKGIELVELGILEDPWLRALVVVFSKRTVKLWKDFEKVKKSFASYQATGGPPEGPIVDQFHAFRKEWQIRSRGLNKALSYLMREEFGLAHPAIEGHIGLYVGDGWKFGYVDIPEFQPVDETPEMFGGAEFLSKMKH